MAAISPAATTDCSGGRLPPTADRHGPETLLRLSAACRDILICLGEDPEREGLRKTPLRMAKALLAVTDGQALEPSTIVADALFSCSSEEMVLVRDIDCYSTCEHHVLPFFGRVHIAYLPAGKVLGISKLARLTDCFAKRLQIQERLTQEIADAVQQVSGARGVAVWAECTHMCMTLRGVQKAGALTVTTAFTGVFITEPLVKASFFARLQVSQHVCPLISNASCRSDESEAGALLAVHPCDSRAAVITVPSDPLAVPGVAATS